MKTAFKVYTTSAIQKGLFEQRILKRDRPAEYVCGIFDEHFNLGHAKTSQLLWRGIRQETGVMLWKDNLSALLCMLSLFKKNGTCCLRCCSKKSVGYKETHLYYSKKDNHPWTGGISMLYGTKTTHHANVNYACRDFYKNQQLSGASIRKKRGHLPRTCGQRCAKKKKGLGGGVFFSRNAPRPRPHQKGQCIWCIWWGICNPHSPPQAAILFKGQLCIWCIWYGLGFRV